MEWATGLCGNINRTCNSMCAGGIRGEGRSRGDAMMLLAFYALLMWGAVKDLQ